MKNFTPKKFRQCSAFSNFSFRMTRRDSKNTDENRRFIFNGFNIRENKRRKTKGNHLFIPEYHGRISRDTLKNENF